MVMGAFPPVKLPKTTLHGSSVIGPQDMADGLLRVVGFDLVMLTKVGSPDGVCERQVGMNIQYPSCGTNTSTFSYMRREIRFLGSYCPLSMTSRIERTC